MRRTVTTAISRPSFLLLLLAMPALAWAGISLAATDIQQPAGDPCTMTAPPTAPGAGPDALLGGDYQLYICSGDHQSAGLNALFAEPLRVRLFYPDGLPADDHLLQAVAIPGASGAAAELIVPGDEGSPGWARTDADGFLEVGARANGVAGTYQVEICLPFKGGCAAFSFTSVMFTLTNTTAGGPLPPSQPVPGLGPIALILLTGLFLVVAVRRVSIPPLRR